MRPAQFVSYDTERPIAVWPAAILFIESVGENKQPPKCSVVLNTRAMHKIYIMGTDDVAHTEWRLAACDDVVNQLEEVLPE